MEQEMKERIKKVNDLNKEINELNKKVAAEGPPEPIGQYLENATSEGNPIILSRDKFDSQDWFVIRVDGSIVFQCEWRIWHGHCTDDGNREGFTAGVRDSVVDMIMQVYG